MAEREPNFLFTSKVLYVRGAWRKNNKTQGMDGQEAWKLTL